MLPFCNLWDFFREKYTFTIKNCEDLKFTNKG